jgi:hypothetical protein
MTTIDISSALASEHIDDLRRAGDRGRLAALARCCRPATWKQAVAGAAAWLRRGQLGPVDGFCPCA